METYIKNIFLLFLDSKLKFLPSRFKAIFVENIKKIHNLWINLLLVFPSLKWIPTEQYKI